MIRHFKRTLLAEKLQIKTRAPMLPMAEPGIDMAAPAIVMDRKEDLSKMGRIIIAGCRQPGLHTFMRLTILKSRKPGCLDLLKITPS